MRLKSEIWVKAYLRRCQSHDAPAFITQRGQSDGGAIFIVINRLDGSRDLYIPAPAGMDATGGRIWSALSSEKPMTEPEVQAYVKRQGDFDPDIWVVEVEDREGRHFLADELSRE